MSDSTTKACMFCAEQIQSAATLCRYCGREQAQQRDPDAEHVLFEGPVPHTAFLPHYFLGFVLTFFVVGIPILIGVYIHARTTKWRITDRRIQVEKGFLTRTVDSLELWRVRDVRFAESIVDRPFGVAEIVLVSTDASTPVLRIRGIPGARGVFDRLKVDIDSAKRSRRVLSVDQ